jgi:hypothetical protein
MKKRQYQHLSVDEYRPRPGDEVHDCLYKAQLVMDAMNTFEQFYKPARDLAVDEAMIGVKGRFILKQYLPAKPAKLDVNAWGIADTKSRYLLKCKIYWWKKRTESISFSWGSKMLLTRRKTTQDCGATFIFRIYSQLNSLNCF